MGRNYSIHLFILFDKALILYAGIHVLGKVNTLPRTGTSLCRPAGKYSRGRTAARPESKRGVHLLAGGSSGSWGSQSLSLLTSPEKLTKAVIPGQFRDFFLFAFLLMVSNERKKCKKKLRK